MTAQMQKHHFPNCNRWKDQRKTLSEEVGKETGCSAGTHRHVTVSELLSIQKCDQAVMDFLSATDVGKIPPKMSEGAKAGEQRAEE